jgi:RND family efflux transporter MFP subunit
MKARVDSVKAELEAAKAAVIQAEATAKSAAAWVRFRDKQYKRMKELFVLKSIEEAVVDESKERYEASVQSELAAVAAIATTKANVVAFVAKIEAARADVALADAEVDVAQAELDRSEVLRGFATITAKFDGVVTQRSLFPGDFVRSANEGSNHEPLLTIERTDKMRVVVQIPDRDVRFADKSDPAIVEVDALGGKQYPAKISRIAKSEDPLTRLMRIEIDLENTDGNILSGMYGKVTIMLDKSTDQLSIPSACLVGKAENDVGTVFVVRDHHAHLVKVKLGIVNDVNIGVKDGLTLDDDVILQPSSTLTEGTQVNPTIEEYKR